MPSWQTKPSQHGGFENWSHCVMDEHLISFSPVCKLKRFHQQVGKKGRNKQRKGTSQENTNGDTEDHLLKRYYRALVGTFLL